MGKLKELWTQVWKIHFFRFCAVAGLNTLFGYSLYALLLTIGLHYVWATLIGQVIGIIFNFKTYGHLVFKNKNNRLVGKFIGVYTFTYLINVIGIGYWVNVVALSDYVAGALMVVPVGLLTYLLNKLLVFRKNKNDIEGGEPMNVKEFGTRILADKPKFIFSLLVLFALVFMVCGSFDAGMSGDEDAHQTQSQKVYAYYASWGQDTSAMADRNMASYGQVIDNFSYAVSQWFQIEDTMQVRHTTNAIFGWIGMLFAALLAFRLGGRKWLPAIFTLTLFFFSPRFMGHSFNDLKDVNLASIMIAGIYYIVVFLQDFPKTKKSTVVMLAVLIGVAIAIRIAGLLLIAYFGFFAFLFFIKSYSFKSLYTGQDAKLFWKNMVGLGILMSIGGYLLAILLWPFAMEGPIKNTMETFTAMSHYSVNIKQLFEGELQWSNLLPWYYTPKYILMTIPMAVIVGSLIRLVTGWRKGESFWTFLLLFCFVFPVFWITYTKANVYGGWRHSMFAYPTLPVLAGLGFYSLVQAARKPALRYFCMALPFLLLWHPIKHTIINHPYEYVYFNELFGGVNKAMGRYETDYYYHSTREATEWVLKNADTSHLRRGEKIKVATWHTSSVAYYLRKDTTHFQPAFSRVYDMGDRDWDYAVFTVTGMNPDWIRNPKTFPPSNAVYTVKVDDVPICIVLKRTDKSDFYAYEAMQKGNRDTAIILYQKALEVNPYNEQALEHLTDLYMQTQQPDLAFPLASRWAENVPSNMTALQQLTNLYYMKQDYVQMLNMAQQMKRVAPTEVMGYWMAAQAYLQMGANAQNLQFALNELQKVVEYRPDFKQAYVVMAQIFQTAGDQASAQRCMSIAGQLQ